MVTGRKPISLVTISDFGVKLMILIVASQQVFPSKIDYSDLVL
jgi:hypothetical protein